MNQNAMKTENRDGYITGAPEENQNCFGCSLKNKSGLQMKFYASEKMDSVISWLKVPDHLCGWSTRFTEALFQLCLMKLWAGRL